MRWTKEKPKEDGWYFIKLEIWGEIETRVRSIFFDEDGHLWIDNENECRLLNDGIYVLEWSSEPIKEPER